MDDPTERQLAEGLRQGRTEAWQAFYDAYAASLWRRISRLMGGRDPSAVGDVVQATLLAAAEAAPTTYEPARGRLWPWLCGIARNQLALHYRRRGPVMPADGEENAENGDDPRGGTWGAWLAGAGDEPPARLHTKEISALVREALARLPVEYEDLLVARYVEGISAEQIAKGRGGTGQSVRSQLARARQAFRIKLVHLAPSLLEQQGSPHERAKSGTPEPT